MTGARDDCTHCREGLPGPTPMAHEHIEHHVETKSCEQCGWSGPRRVHDVVDNEARAALSYWTCARCGLDHSESHERPAL